MDQKDLAAIARSLFDAFNQRDMSVWERALAADFVADYPSAPRLDRKAARAYNEPFAEAFPDLRFDVERTIVQGDTVVLDGTAGGTFTRPLQGPGGPIPPNGSKGMVRIVLIAVIRDGKIVSEQTVWNQYDLFQQLGLIPARAA